MSESQQDNPNNSRVVLTQLNAIEEKAAITSSIQGVIKKNVDKYMSGYDSQGRNIRREAMRKSIEERKIAVKRKREKVVTAIIVGGLLLIVIGFGFALKYALDTSPLYGKQHDPSATPVITQQYEEGNSYGGK